MYILSLLNPSLTNPEWERGNDILFLYQTILTLHIESRRKKKRMRRNRRRRKERTETQNLTVSLHDLWLISSILFTFWVNRWLYFLKVKRKMYFLTCQLSYWSVKVIFLYIILRCTYCYLIHFNESWHGKLYFQDCRRFKDDKICMVFSSQAL